MSAEEPWQTSTASELQRHPSLEERFDPAVRIIDYERDWPMQAEQELRRINNAVGEVAVRFEHVGSTAVPGLAAKPIIDLLLSVKALEPRECYVEPLERLGYLFAPAPGSGRHFFAKPAERPRTHHVHVVEAGSDHEFRHLAVRDFLRDHPDEAARYAALKRELVARHPQDRLAYIDGKPLAHAADKNCSDFSTQQQAQQFFDSYGGSPSNDVDGLDRDHDGVVCEDLRSGPGKPSPPSQPPALFNGKCKRGLHPDTH
jgi:GrpB-like predicted nucleotidyltransferase (UPF0157 family)